jgi:ABC-type dipeptide/oligopeptide/nickel transport system permease component
MLRFLLSRILLLIPTFIGISIVSFGFIRMLPGDPVLLMASTARSGNSISAICGTCCKATSGCR